MNATPKITQREAQPYAGISAWVTMAAVGSVADRIPELFGWLGAHGIAPAGPPFFRYHVIDMDRQLLVEAGVPVASPVDDDGDIKGGTLPAGPFAVMTHTGAPDTLGAATAALLDWAEARGLAQTLARPNTPTWRSRRSLRRPKTSSSLAILSAALTGRGG
jgi:effector-binding domain-containing protein